VPFELFRRIVLLAAECLCGRDVQECRDVGSRREDPHQPFREACPAAVAVLLPQLDDRVEQVTVVDDRPSCPDVHTVATPK
jgi:hypothetical protein